MSDPRISVLVPAWNRSGTIAKCLRSALDAGYADLEVIVADNGSTDGTADLVAGIAAADARVRLIRHPVNRGPMPNWRSCLDAATGGLVHWLWSDDWVEPGFYRQLVDGMAQHGAAMAVSAAQVVDPEQGARRVVHQLPAGPVAGRELARWCFDGRRVSSSPAAALLPIGPCRRHFAEDIPPRLGLECCRRAIGPDALMILGCAWESASAWVSPEPLVNFRSHSSSISLSHRGWVVGAHYARARLWWRARQRAPWAWGHLDRLRMARYLVMRALGRG